MIFSTGPASENFEHQLHSLEADCQVEQTADGFDFHVVDSQRLQHPYGISGFVSYRPEDIELNLLMGSDIAPDVRPKIAEFCIEMASLRGQGTPLEYLLCEAGQRLLPVLEPEIRYATSGVVYKNLAEFRRWTQFMDSQRRYMGVTAQERQQLKHSLGWVALERSMDDTGKEIVANLMDRGLILPSIADNEVLVASGKGPLQGVSVTAYSAVEKGLNHKCKGCSGEIHPGTVRITASYDVEIKGYDHHHYHSVCYAETDMRHLNLATARNIRSEW